MSEKSHEGPSLMSPASRRGSRRLRGRMTTTPAPDAAAVLTDENHALEPPQMDDLPEEISYGGSMCPESPPGPWAAHIMAVPWARAHDKSKQTEEFGNTIAFLSKQIQWREPTFRDMTHWKGKNPNDVHRQLGYSIYNILSAIMQIVGRVQPKSCATCELSSGPWAHCVRVDNIDPALATEALPTCCANCMWNSQRMATCTLKDEPMSEANRGNRRRRYEDAEETLHQQKRVHSTPAQEETSQDPSLIRTEQRQGVDKALVTEIAEGIMHSQLASMEATFIHRIAATQNSYSLKLDTVKAQRDALVAESSSIRTESANLRAENETLRIEIANLKAEQRVLKSNMVKLNTRKEVATALFGVLQKKIDEIQPAFQVAEGQDTDSENTSAAPLQVNTATTPQTPVPSSPAATSIISSLEYEFQAFLSVMDDITSALGRN